MLIEYIHINTGHMAHHHGWTSWYSYVADWILFLMFIRIIRSSISKSCQDDLVLAIKLHFTSTD
ncbi:hypothetical protein [Pelosinus fermentans]|uniref:hypothetical protein n=1 Tax=Pelosinus fermentans TaxID=365349 RepID=UPI002E16668D